MIKQPGKYFDTRIKHIYPLIRKYNTSYRQRLPQGLLGIPLFTGRGACVQKLMNRATRRSGEHQFPRQFQFPLLREALSRGSKINRPCSSKTTPVGTGIFHKNQLLHKLQTNRRSKCDVQHKFQSTQG